MYDAAVCLDTSPPKSATSVLSVARVDSLRANDAMTAFTFSGSRREPSTRGMSSSATISFCRRGRNSRVTPNRRRPSAANDALGDLGRTHRSEGAPELFARNNARQLNRTARFPKFEKRHGVHAQFSEPSSATVHRPLIVSRCRRPRKYELARLAAAVVALKPCRVPKFRNLLPFVDQPRNLTRNGKRRVRLGTEAILEVARRVHEEEPGRRTGPGRGCLPAPFRSFDENGTEYPKHLVELIFDNSSVVLFWHSFHHCLPARLTKFTVFI